MVVFALHIISKAGGLIYNREFHTGLSKLTSNDYLMLAGSFHGMHAITKQLCPAPPTAPNTTGTPAVLTASPFSARPSGIEVLESSHFRMQCFQTQTGTKFLLFTEPHQPNIDSMVKKIYELYADYVMKNPFYTVEMPIRCEKFDRGLDGFVKGPFTNQFGLDGTNWVAVGNEGADFQLPEMLEDHWHDYGRWFGG